MFDRHIDSELSSELRRALVDEFMELATHDVTPDDIVELESRISDTLKRSGFEAARHFPEYIKRAAQMVHAAKVYRELKLPTTGERVIDKREDIEKAQATKEQVQKTSEENKDAAAKQIEEATAEKKTDEKSAVREAATKEGKLIHKGEAARLQSQGKTDEQAKRAERLLSAFEQLVRERFERGRTVAHESSDGEAHFSPKTREEWGQFFTRFADRLVGKRVLLSDIQEFLFRGLVMKGNRGIVIADLVRNDARMEKFVRFSVFAEALAQLKALVPGQRFATGALAGLTGEEFVYLALAVSRGKAFQFSDQPAQGKFFGGAAEARAASELGIALHGEQDQRGRVFGRRKKFGFAAFGGEGDIFEEDPSRFVPWWHWGRLGKPGRSRWTAIAFYLSLLAIALLGVGVLTNRLLF